MNLRLSPEALTAFASRHTMITNTSNTTSASNTSPRPDLSRASQPLPAGKVWSLVVKVGTSVVTREEGQLDYLMIETLAREITDLLARGIRVTLVTSGAVGSGLGALGLTERPKEIPTLQAAAAIGQIRLMAAYEAAFAHYGATVAQVLLTAADLDHRNRYLNISNTLDVLWQKKVIPIINENDTVAVDELKFGDNDQLAVQLVDVIDAHVLVLLSDVDGLFTANPHTNPSAERLPVVEKVTPEIFGLAGASISKVSRGGMKSKLTAAQAITSRGGYLVLGDGKRPQLHEILSSPHRGTVFLPSSPHAPSRRERWLAASTVPRTILTVDAGAVDALRYRGKSLLAVGVTAFTEEFQRGDPVLVVGDDGEAIGKGLVNYNATELRKIMGRTSAEILSILGYDFGPTLIHRDNFILIGGHL